MIMIRLTFSLLLLAMLPLTAAPFIVAHRGASAEAPENTLPAFELAWKQNADAIEGDFYLTKDGQIVCFHDRETKRITGKILNVAESTLAELQALDAGAWKDQRFAGTRMPTLTDVLATVPPSKKIYIEIKCGPEIIPALLKVVAASKLTDEQIVVIAFEAAVIAAVKSARPSWTANWLFSFDKKSSPEKQLPAVLKTLKTIEADGLGSSAHPSLTREHLDQLRAAGFQHHVWTVNTAKAARHFLEIGTQSITSDVPGNLRKALER